MHVRFASDSQGRAQLQRGSATDAAVRVGLARRAIGARLGADLATLGRERLAFCCRHGVDAAAPGQGAGAEEDGDEEVSSGHGGRLVQAVCRPRALENPRTQT